MESQLIFAPLGTPHSRWKSLLMGWGLQAQLLLAVLVLNAVFPKQMQQGRRYVVANLVAPADPVINERRPVNPRLVPKPVPPPVETLTTTKLVVPRHVHEVREPEPVLKPPDIKLTSTTPELPKLASAPITKIVAASGFGTPTEGTPTSSKPAAQIQTGGFGDPNGIATRGDGKLGVHVAAKGDLALPTSVGFGDRLAVAAGVHGAGIAGSGIQSSGFDKQYQTPAASHTAIANNEPGSPVEIIEKPKPTYTEEGRKHGVQGEVLLEVQFTADGHVRVLQVLQGLGFGLDEQAVHCAEHITFKPATHGGLPIDSKAVVHIVFELVT